MSQQIHIAVAPHGWVGGPSKHRIVASPGRGATAEEREAWRNRVKAHCANRGITLSYFGLSVIEADSGIRPPRIDDGRRCSEDAARAWKEAVYAHYGSGGGFRTLGRGVSVKVARLMSRAIENQGDTDASS